MMQGNTPILTRAVLRLQVALQDLDQTITDRYVIQKLIDESWKQVASVMKTLDRRWDRADYNKLLKLQVKHSNLQQRLTRVHRACTLAREAYQDRRERYDIVRDDQSAMDSAAQTALKQMHQRQGAMSRSLNTMFRTLLPNIAPQYQVREGAYDYITVDIPDFFDLLVDLDRLLSNDPDYSDAADRYRPVSFLEVGAGSGRNLVLANSSQLVLFRDVSGFDINPDLTQNGQQGLGLQDSLQVGDAMSFDYEPYDVLYSYRPMQNSKMQAELEAYMARSMRLNAYLLAPLAHDLSLCPELTPIAGAPNIWKKTEHFG